MARNKHRKNGNGNNLPQLKESPIKSLANPQDVMDFANTLRDFIEKQNLAITIQKSKYVLVDGWKFAGLNFGLTAICDEPEKLSDDKRILTAITHTKMWNGKKEFKIASVTDIPEQIKIDTEHANFFGKKLIREYKYRCKARLVNIVTGKEMGNGVALCSNEEGKKAAFDEYAVLSMSQTRAIAKAYRNLIGFVMTAAGYESTPAEEMEEFIDITPENKATQGIPEEMKMEILTIADEPTLLSWAGDQTEYHQNHEFRKLVNERKIDIRNNQAKVS